MELILIFFAIYLACAFLWFLYENAKKVYRHKKWGISEEPLLRQYKGYPPDWENRRGEVIKRAGERCEKCGRRGAHIHHKNPIKKGGDHHLNNLEYLCLDCHSTMHPKNAQLKNMALKRRLKSLFISRNSKTEITLIVKTQDRMRDIGVKGLKHIPNVGDEFMVYFIDAFCKVAKVNHYLERGIHEIHIYLEERPLKYL